MIQLLRQSANRQAKQNTVKKDGLISSHKNYMEQQIFSNFGIVLEGNEYYDTLLSRRSKK